MRRLVRSLAMCLLMCLVSGAAHGQSAERVAVGADDDPPPSEVEVGIMDRVGIDLAARTGFALPLGDIAEGSQISALLSGVIPVGLELALWANKNVSVGVGVDVASGLTRNCDPGDSCSAIDYRLSVEGIFTSRAGMAADLWLGLGAGYEWLELSESGNGDVELTGWNYASIEVGGEIRAGEQCGLSPFFGVSVGEFTSGSVGGLSENVANPSLHAWLQFGLRGVINL